MISFGVVVTFYIFYRINTKTRFLFNFPPGRLFTRFFFFHISCHANIVIRNIRLFY